MIRSMTGFGKASGTYAGRQMDVEIRTLNSKTADISVKIPLLYRDREMEIRNLVTEILQRGKIDVYITFEGGMFPGVGINVPLAEKYITEWRKLATLANQTVEPDYVSLLSKIPDIMKADAEETDPREWEELFSILREALHQTDAFRQKEGNVLYADFILRINNIESFLLEIETLDKGRIENRKEKLTRALDDLQQGSADPLRFEQELIYYLEKMDVTEEKIRLHKHLSFFKKDMEDDSAQGRKMQFTLQEMGREINTLGSKAYDADIQRYVVLMKDELEKIKEQLANIL